MSTAAPQKLNWCPHWEKGSYCSRGEFHAGMHAPGRQELAAPSMELYVQVEQLSADRKWIPYSPFKVVMTSVSHPTGPTGPASPVKVPSGDRLVIDGFEQQVVDWLRSAVVPPGLYRFGGMFGSPVFEWEVKEGSQYWRRLA